MHSFLKVSSASSDHETQNEKAVDADKMKESAGIVILRLVFHCQKTVSVK